MNINKILITVLAFSLMLGLSLSSACRSNTAQPGMAWLKQAGTGEGQDDAASAVFSGRDVYIAGYTSGTLSGQEDSGIHDALVMAYDKNARELWQKQFGTSKDTYARAVFADASGIYAAGNATGAFPGLANAGNIDAFLYKLDLNGNPAWVRQFGGPENDYAYAVSGYGGDVYAAGVTYGTLSGQTGAGGSDCFLTKYDAGGTEIWTRQFGTPLNDYGYAVFADKNGVYVAGITYGEMSPLCVLGGAEAFVRKFDFQGNEGWTQQWGTDVNDYANAVTAGEDGIYVLGLTFGALTAEPNRGRADTFVSKLGFDGELLWTRQFGTDASDFAWAVSAQGGRVYVTGYTSGTFDGQVNAGQYDAYAAAFDGDGDLLWLHEFGTLKDDYVKGISAGPAGVFIAGSTWGAFSARQGNDADIILARFEK